MGDKVLNDAAALMRSVVSKRGRNVEIAESTVRVHLLHARRRLRTLLLAVDPDAASG